MKHFLLFSLTLALSLAAFPCWAAEPKSDQAKAIAEIVQDNRRMRAELANAELIAEHHRQVIEILARMPEAARKLLSLDRMTFDAEGRIDLRPVAEAHLKAGRIIILKAGGLTHPARADYEKRMHDKYGLMYVEFGQGCTTEDLLRKSIDEYNDVVYVFIRKKYPALDFEKEFEAVRAEWEKKNNPPTPPAR